jgi:transposase
LIILKNIQIVLLPPYCPEFNPTQSGWKIVEIYQG